VDDLLFGRAWDRGDATSGRVGRGADMESWARLTEELDLWAEAGVSATFWWRDDDAIEPTSQLEHLLACAGSIPLALAVIPGLATPALGERLRDQPSVVVLQHGWLHANHAPGGNDEYPSTRLQEDVSRELTAGRERLVGLFGTQAIPVFAPPWHGFAPCFFPQLAETGIMAISRKGPRNAALAAAGLFQVNAHVSPIAWTEPPSFRDDDDYLDQFVDHLRGRRLGAYDREEPTGLLTHHLAQNARSYAFIVRFVDLISGHPAAVWLHPQAVFAPALQ
jgi:hypothetical protein